MNVNGRLMVAVFSALLVTGAGALAAEQHRGAFDGVGNLLRSPGQAAPKVTLTQPVSLSRQVNEAVADLTKLADNQFGTVKETAKLSELTHVFRQLQENVAVATDPDEITFLADEFDSLKDQYRVLATTVLQTDPTNFAAAIKALQDKAPIGPRTELPKLAQLAEDASRLRDAAAVAASRGDLKSFVLLFEQLQILRGKSAELEKNLLIVPPGLVKLGPGKLIMTGDSTYTAATTVAQGTLQLEGSLASRVVVMDGAHYIEPSGIFRIANDAPFPKR